MATDTELGELTIQYVAKDGAGKDELEEFRSELRRLMGDFDNLKAVQNDFALEEFDPRLLEDPNQR